MHIHNGDLTFTKDLHDNDVITATTTLEPREPADFHTPGAAIFWLWLIDERVSGQRRRMGVAA